MHWNEQAVRFVTCAFDDTIRAGNLPLRLYDRSILTSLSIFPRCPLSRISEDGLSVPQDGIDIRGVQADGVVRAGLRVESLRVRFQVRAALSICLSVCLSGRLAIHPSIHLCLPVCLSACLCVSLSLSLSLSDCLSVCLSLPPPSLPALSPSLPPPPLFVRSSLPPSSIFTFPNPLCSLWIRRKPVSCVMGVHVHTNEPTTICKLLYPWRKNVLTSINQLSLLQRLCWIWVPLGKVTGTFRWERQIPSWIMRCTIVLSCKHEMAPRH